MQKQQEKHMTELRKYRVFGPCATKFGADNTGSWRYERPVVDYDKCIKCGTCERFCPANVVYVKKDQKECIEFNYDYCKGCGICVNECPTKCMKMVPERGEE